MKKILFIITICICIILISIKVNYKSNYDFYIGSNNGKYNYIYNDTRIEDIIYDIDNNIYIKDKHIQNILVKSNTIYVNLNSLYINNKSIYYIEILISRLRKYSKEKIIVTVLKNNDILSKSVNRVIFKLKDKYDIILVR